MSKTYSTLSNARRAAKTLGLDLNTLAFFAVSGGFAWVVRTNAVLRDEPVNLPALPTKPAAQVEAELAAALPSPKTPTHKEFSVFTRSSVLSPVQFVHSFLNERGAGLTRKQALYELAQFGVNYATARTQYQRWFTANRK